MYYKLITRPFIRTCKEQNIDEDILFSSYLNKAFSIKWINKTVSLACNFNN